MKDKRLKSDTNKVTSLKKGNQTLKETVQDSKDNSKTKMSSTISNKRASGNAPKSKSTMQSRKNKSKAVAKPKTSIAKKDDFGTTKSKSSAKTIEKKPKTVVTPKTSMVNKDDDSTIKSQSNVTSKQKAIEDKKIETNKDGLELLNHFSIKLPYDKNIISFNIKKAIENGSYEGKEAREIDRIVQQGERILEVGAGLGFISSIASKNDKVESVMAIEANPNLISYIKNVHKINNTKNIEVINGILSNSTKERATNFYIRNDFWASSLSPKPENFIKTVTVPVYSLSEIIESYRPTLIICDIEGGELDLFKNANLEGVEKVFVEIHQKVLGRMNIKKLFDSFSARDFHYDQHHSCGSVILFSHVYRGLMRRSTE